MRGEEAAAVMDDDLAKEGFTKKLNVYCYIRLNYKRGKLYECMGARKRTAKKKKRTGRMQKRKGRQSKGVGGWMEKERVMLLLHETNNLLNSLSLFCGSCTCSTAAAATAVGIRLPLFRCPEITLMHAAYAHKNFLFSR